MAHWPGTKMANAHPGAGGGLIFPNGPSNKCSLWNTCGTPADHLWHINVSQHTGWKLMVYTSGILTCTSGTYTGGIASKGGGTLATAGAAECHTSVSNWLTMLLWWWVDAYTLTWCMHYLLYILCPSNYATVYIDCQWPSITSHMGCSPYFC